MIKFDTSPGLNHLLATRYAETRRFREASSHEEKALNLARAAGRGKLVQEFEKRLKIYKQLSNFSK